jgi:hypothetical protein
MKVEFEETHERQFTSRRLWRGVAGLKVSDFSKAIGVYIFSSHGVQ